MTAVVQFDLALQGGAGTHSATVTLPASSPKRWARRWALLTDRPGSKHSIGVHVYSRRWPTSDPVVFAYELAIRWSNGAVKPNGSGFCGRVYYDALDMRIGGDENLVLVVEPRAGGFYSASTGVYSVARGGGHVFPPRAVLERRFLVVPKTMPTAELSALRDKTLGFKGVRFSQTKRWGPAQEEQPVINGAHYGNVFRAAVQQTKGLLAAGARGFVTGGPNFGLLDLRNVALGPFMPDGDPQAGAPAGYEIDLAYGWAQVPEALEHAAMAHECSMARNTVAWFDMVTGDQLGVDDWITTESGRPQLMAGGKLELPAFCVPGQSYANFNSGACNYQPVLEGYSDDDAEHVVRALDDAAQLAFSAEDAMAADDLRMLFEHHRAFTYNDRADAMNVSWSGYASLTKDIAYLQANPHKGSARFLRQWGWTLTLGVFARSTSFCRKMVEAWLLGVDSCGIEQREYHTPYMPAGVQGTQHFHGCIDKAAVIRAARFLADPTLTGRVLDALHVWRKKVVENPALIQVRADNAGVRGTAKWIYRQGADGREIDPITAADCSGGGFQEHELAVLGLAALCELDLGDKDGAINFLSAGLPLEVPHANLSQRLAWIRARTGDWNQYASYAAACEAAGIQ